MKAQKLPSGNYRVQLYLGVDAQGKKIMKSINAKTEWEAIKAATEFKNSRVKFDKKNVTVEQAIRAYIDSRKNVISASTLHGYDVIARHRLQCIKKYFINRLDKVDIQRAINSDVAIRGLGWKSCHDSLALLRSACEFFNVEIDPIKKFSLPPKKPKKPELPELNVVLDILLGSSVELPSLLSLWAGGMRISEVRGLQYRDVSTSADGRHYINISRSRVYVNGKDNIKDTNKTYGSTRRVPLDGYLYHLIESKPHGQDTDFIIDESYNAITGRFNRLMRKHGIKMSFHDLRALFASTMNSLGIPKEVLQALGGWTNSVVLDQRYIRYGDRALSESLDVLSQKMYEKINEKEKENDSDASENKKK